MLSDGQLIVGQSVLNSVLYLSSLAVVESVECAYEISCDSSDSLEANAFTDLTVYILYYLVIHTSTSVRVIFFVRNHFMPYTCICKAILMYIVVYFMVYHIILWISLWITLWIILFPY